jgi:predicted nucleic acid-binding protein
MDLADVSPLWLANKTDITDVITIDRADFSVCRTVRRKMFRNLFIA